MCYEAKVTQSLNSNSTSSKLVLVVGGTLTNLKGVKFKILTHFLLILDLTIVKLAFEQTRMVSSRGF